jgi:hypothetical protein
MYAIHPVLQKREGSGYETMPNPGPRYSGAMGIDDMLKVTIAMPRWELNSQP